MIDLHVHSTFSDGSLTPEELADEAASAGLTALALTDHDSVDGVGRFLTACDSQGAEGPRKLLGISGVEISVDVSRGTLHMLGYFVQPDHADLKAMLKRICDGRNERNRVIIERLNDLGIPLTLEEVSRFAREDVVGRPHFAAALKAKGHVRSIKEAFDRFLAKGKPAYFNRLRLSPEESIRTILRAGGLPVLAHPATLELDRAALKEYVGGLKELGLQGVEVYYSEHTPSRTEEYLHLVRELKLAATGGTDFHGAVTPDIQLGRGFGNLKIPDDLIENLHRRRDELRRV